MISERDNNKQQNFHISHSFISTCVKWHWLTFVNVFEELFLTCGCVFGKKISYNLILSFYIPYLFLTVPTEDCC